MKTYQDTHEHECRGRMGICTKVIQCWADGCDSETFTGLICGDCQTAKAASKKKLFGAINKIRAYHDADPLI